MLTEIFRTKSALLFNGDGRDLYRAVAPNVFHTLIFDPPWDRIGEFDMRQSDNVLAFCDGQRAGDIVRLFGAPAWVFVWDCVSCWFTPSRPLKRAKMCFWYGDASNYRQSGHLVGEQSTKPRVVRNSRGEYLFTPKAGKMLADIYSAPITALHAHGTHRHSKPIEWLAGLIGNTARPGDLVIDPFAGSGATLQAASLAGFNWLGSEIDGRACELIAAMGLPSAIPRPEQWSLL